MRVAKAVARTGRVVRIGPVRTRIFRSCASIVFEEGTICDCNAERPGSNYRSHNGVGRPDSYSTSHTFSGETRHSVRTAAAPAFKGTASSPATDRRRRDARFFAGDRGNPDR